MMIKHSPCLKYSRPRLDAKRPAQQRAQISPVISWVLLRFIRGHNHKNPARLKQLNDGRHATLVVGLPLDDIFRPADSISFTPSNLAVENRCLKIQLGKAVVGQLVLCVNRKDILSVSHQRFNLFQYTREHYIKVTFAPIGKPNPRLIKCPSWPAKLTGAKRTKKVSVHCNIESSLTRCDSDARRVVQSAPGKKQEGQ